MTHENPRAPKPSPRSKQLNVSWIWGVSRVRSHRQEILGVGGHHCGSVVRGRTHGQRHKPSLEATPPAPEQRGHGEKETLCKEPVSEDTRAVPLVGAAGGRHRGHRTLESPHPWGFLASNSCQFQYKVPASHTREKPHLVEWLNPPKGCPQGLPRWPQFVRQVVHCLPRQCKEAPAERGARTLPSFTPTADPTV